ncbi:MAG: ATP-binding protein, partial [Acidobacteriota bacterium]
MATGLEGEELNRISAQVLSRLEQVSQSFDWKANTTDLYLSVVNRANRELSEIQLRLSAKTRRLELRDRVLTAFVRLNQALDGPVSSAQGLAEVFQLMGDLLPHRKMIGYIAQQHPRGLEGCLKRSEKAASERFSLPLNESSAEPFETLTTRAQIHFLHQALDPKNGAIEGGLEFVAMFQDPHLLIFPLECQRGLIGQMLVEVEPDVHEHQELLEAARSYSQGAALALDRLLLTEDLQRQAEALALTGRKVEETERLLFHNERLASVGRLAAGTAHEINNPLTVISGHAELLLRSAGDERQRRRLQEIARQVERISDITANLMRLARPAEPQIEPVQLKPLIEGTIHLLRQRIRVANIEVRKEMHAVPTILADPKQLEQVFLNLAINAVQAMPSGGRLFVRLRTSEDGKEVQIELQDSGKGIRPEDLPSIFDPFFTTKEEGEGTGLGLANCLSIIRSHGGRILVS